MHEHRSDHFVVTSDAEPDVVQAVTVRLESTYQAVVRFAQQIGVPVQASDVRLPVTLFDRYDDFRAAMRAADLDPETFVGFYDQKTNRSFFCNVEHLPQVEAIPPGPQRAALVEQIHQLVIAHEAAHQVLFNIGVLTRSGADHPEWWVEGLACLFEAPLADPPHPERPTNRHRLDDLVEAVSANKQIKLADLIVALPERQADAQNTRGRYAQAWGLLEFLRRTKPSAVSAFAKLQAAKTPGAAAPNAAQRLAEFESTFGPIEEQAFLGWVRSLRDPPTSPLMKGGD